MKLAKPFQWAICLMAALGASTGNVEAQDKPVQLRIAQLLPVGHPLHPAMQAWLDSITEESKGSITGTIFPSEQLGKAFDSYDLARDGLADVSQVVPGYQPGRFPIIGVLELPFLITDGPKGAAAFDGWYRVAGAPREMRDVHYCFTALQTPGTIHSKSLIVAPSDLKGLKLRPTGSVVGQLFTSLGATNVQASPSESRDIIERGVADGMTFPYGSLFTFGIDRVVKYHVDIPLYTSPFVWVFNKDKYDSMSPAQKLVIDHHCTPEWGAKISKVWADFEDAGKVKIKSLPDHVVTVPNAAQMAEWHKASEPVRKLWADAVRKAGNADPDVVLKEVSAQLSKVGAGGL